MKAQSDLGVCGIDEKELEKIASLPDDAQERIKGLLGRLGWAFAATADKFTAAAGNAPKTLINAPQAATPTTAPARDISEEQARFEKRLGEVLEEMKAATLAESKAAAATAATGLRLFFRNEVRYYAGETCAAAVVTSLPVFTKTQPTDEDGVHYTATQTEAVEWCSAAYKQANNPFAVISRTDGGEAETCGTFETAAKANAAAQARLGGKGTMGKNKLVFGCAGKEYVAAVPFAVFAAVPALRCTNGELRAYARACAEIAGKRPADAYGINFKETAKNGRVFIDVYDYV